MPDGTHRHITDWNDWRQWRVSVLYIEELTEYDFLANIPQEIQDNIEQDDSSPLPVPINNSASLLASSSQGIFGISGNSINNIEGIKNISTRKINSSDVSPFQVGFSQVSPFKVSPFQVGFHKSRAEQVGIFEVSSSEISSTKINIPNGSLPQISPFKNGIDKISGENNVTQISSAQIGSAQFSIIHSRSTQVGSTQIGSIQLNSSPFSPTQVNSTQVCSIQIDPLSLAPIQFNSSKISLPSSISSEQFFSIHNSTPQTLNHLNFTAQTLWQSHFNRQSPPDITLQITDFCSV